jgi:hypothetical protein
MVKLTTAAPDCAPGSCEEARRSGGGPADRPHPAANPTCRYAFDDWALSEGYDGDPCPHLLVAMEPDRRHPVKARAVRAPGSAGLRP